MTVEVDPELYPYGKAGRPGSLLDIALTHGVQIEHACGGVGVCATCHVIVAKGEENLSPPTDEELDRADYAPGATPQIVQQKAQEAEAALRFERQQLQAAGAQGGAGGQFAQNAAK